MSTEGKWYIFHLYNREDGAVNFDAKEEVAVTRKEELLDANRAVNEFFASQNVVKSVYANRNDVLQSIVEMAKAYSDTPQAAQQIIEQANFDISRRFANLCSLFRSFLDHYNRYFVNTHGDKSAHSTAWNDSLSREYDGELAYRIVYMMRNYIQHYDMPPLSIGITDTADKPGFQTRVDIDLDALTQDKKIEKKLEVTGDKLPSRLPLLSIIDSWSKCFDKIVNESNKVRAKYALKQAETVLNVRKSLGLNEVGRLAIIYLPKTDVKPDKLTFNLLYLEEGKAKAISALVE